MEIGNWVRIKSEFGDVYGYVTDILAEKMEIVVRTASGAEYQVQERYCSVETPMQG